MKLKPKNKADDKRARHILELYKSGKTLSEIGEVFRFTRSRAQQIVIKEMKKDISKRLGIEKLKKDEQVLLDVAVKEEMHEIAENRKVNRKTNEEQEYISRVSKKMKELPDYHIFTTVSEYVRALNENPAEFKKYFPGITASIVQKQKKKWSRSYAKCRICETTSVKHMSHGLCENCYYKSDIFKDMQSASRIRNSNRWKKSQRAYAREYSRRPEVIERMRQKEDQKKYGGNREKAIKRDGYRCQQCGITREESQNKIKRDLYVCHMNGADDNRLESLTTLCQKCHSRHAIELMYKSMRLIKKQN